MRFFAANLQRMGEALTENYARLRTQVHRINESWRDQDNAKFMNVFENDADNIRRIAEHMEAYGRFVTAKADRLQDYLNTQMGGY